MHSVCVTGGKYVIWTLVFLPALLSLVNGRATIYFRYDSWTGDGLNYYKSKCDQHSSSRKCDYVFVVKLGDNAKFGRHETAAWDDAPETITDFSRITTQPLVFSVNDDPIPAELALRIDVLDRDHSTDDLVMPFITKVPITPTLFNDSANWISTSRSDGKKRIRFSYRVVCSENYYGSDCMTRCIQRDDSSGHYTCSRSGQRVCLQNYLPPDCTSLHPCSSNSTCSYRGTCIPNGSGSSYSCLCNAGYNGLRCEQSINACNGVQCANGGTCQFTGREWRCVCASGWTGRQCEIARVEVCDRALRTICRNDANCTRVYDGVGGYGPPNCHCLTGYTGQFCEERHACYRANTCSNRGSCMVKNESFECLCDVGYSGVDCEVARDPCVTWQCYNGATCRALGLWNATCVCPTGWTGEKCEFQETITCEQECPTGLQCSQTLVNGNYTAPRCIKMLAMRSADAAKMEDSAEKSPAIWIYLFVGAAGLLVLLAVLFGLLYARRSKQADKLRIMSRVTSQVSGDYSNNNVGNEENFYEDEAQIEFLSQQRQRADSIYDEPMHVDSMLNATASDQHQSATTVSKKHNGVSLSRSCETGKLMVTLPSSEYDTPSSSAAYSVPPIRNNDSLLSRPLPVTPSDATVKAANSQAGNAYSGCVELPEKPTTTIKKRNSNLYSESPTLQRRECPAGNEQLSTQTNAACADSNEAVQHANAANVYNVPSSIRSTDSTLN